MSYKIKKTLAKNALAEVLLADFSGHHHTCQVVVKTVLPNLTDDVIERLQLTKSFSHRGIQEIVDYGHCENTIPRKYYLSSKYCPAVTLTQVMSTLTTLNREAPISFVLHVLCSVCNALEYLHDLGIDQKNQASVVHGGICLDNIIITMNGDVCLVDAGIADLIKYRFTGTELTPNTATPFHHPELPSNIPPQKYHEIYSTGLLLLCMLIGKRTFEEFCNSHEIYKLKTIGQFFPSIPNELEKIIEYATKFRGLGKLVRYESITDFYYDLIAYAKNESITYNRDVTSLLISALFNQLENEPVEHYREQRNKATSFINEGNDDALKKILNDLLTNDTSSFLTKGGDSTGEDTIPYDDRARSHNTVSSSPPRNDDKNGSVTGYTTGLPYDTSVRTGPPSAPKVDPAIFAPSPSRKKALDYDHRISAANPTSDPHRSTTRPDSPPPNHSAQRQTIPTRGPAASPQYQHHDNSTRHGISAPTEITANDHPADTVLQGFFQKSPTGTIHAFSNILRKKQVIDAQLFFAPPVEGPSAPPANSVPHTAGGENVGSFPEAFSRLQINKNTAIGKNHHNSFS